MRLRAPMGVRTSGGLPLSSGPPEVILLLHVGWALVRWRGTSVEGVLVDGGFVVVTACIHK